MPKKEIIHFGEDDFTVLPMTLGQIEEVLPLLQDMKPGIGSQLPGLMSILQIALAPDNPGFDPRKVRATLSELAAAVKTILSMSGLTQGEAPAPVNSTSPTSSAPSPSAATTRPRKPGR